MRAVLAHAGEGAAHRSRRAREHERAVRCIPSRRRGAARGRSERCALRAASPSESEERAGGRKEMAPSSGRRFSIDRSVAHARSRPKSRFGRHGDLLQFCARVIGKRTRLAARSFYLAINREGSGRSCGDWRKEVGRACERSDATGRRLARSSFVARSRQGSDRPPAISTRVDTEGLVRRERHLRYAQPFSLRCAFSADPVRTFAVARACRSVGGFALARTTGGASGRRHARQ